jgi:hypothetical protein
VRETCADVRGCLRENACRHAVHIRTLDPARESNRQTLETLVLKADGGTHMIPAADEPNKFSDLLYIIENKKILFDRWARFRPA